MDTNDNSTQGGTQQSPSPLDLVFLAKIDNAQTISSILNTLHHGPTGGKQGKKKGPGVLVNIIISEKGIKFTVDNVRCYQANTFLQAELFQQYHFQTPGGKEEFSVGLGALLDCLNIYGTFSGAKTALQIAYQAWGKPLCLMLEGNNVVTDCGIRTVPYECLRYDLRTSEIVCKIIMKSDALHDAFNELDWSNEFLSWTISPDAPHFRLTTQGSGTLCQVDYPKDCEVFEEFKCVKTIRKEYKMKHIQPCLKALGLAQKTQIRMNEQGLLALQHMVAAEENFVFIDFFIVPLEHEDDDD